MKTALLVLGALLALLAGVAAWMGAFASVQVQEQDINPYPFVYVQDTTTDFSKVGELTEKLGGWLAQGGYPTNQPAQVYYPVGRGIQNQIGFIIDRAIPAEQLDAETFFRAIPAQRCLVARFPFKNRFSFILGHGKVGPALDTYRKQKGYPETYAIVILEGKSILYLQPVAG